MDAERGLLLGGRALNQVPMWAIFGKQNWRRGMNRKRTYGT